MLLISQKHKRAFSRRLGSIVRGVLARGAIHIQLQLLYQNICANTILNLHPIG